MKRALAAVLVAVTLSLVGIASQQFPILDAVANRIIQKYQNSTCEQLWQERSERRSQPRPPQEQHAIEMLQTNPQMRAEFINRVAAPIANKLFDCGMIP